MYALCDERCSVQCTCCNVEVLYVHGDDRLPFIWHDAPSAVDTSAVVSARARGVCSVLYSYKFFLQVDALRTVSTRQNKECLTEEWHPCSVNNWVHVHLYFMLFLETTVPSNSFCRLTVSRLFLRIRTGNSWQNQMSATLVYYR